MRRITYWLSLALIFTIPFKEIFVLPGIGSVSRVLGLLVAALWALAVARSGLVRKPSLFHYVAFGFFLWNLASILWSINPDASIERTSTYLRMAIFIWMIWDLYEDRISIWRGCQAYVLGTWVTCGSLFFNYLNNVEAYRNANGRFAATGFNTNETGLLLALALPLAWYLAVSSPLFKRNSQPQPPTSAATRHDWSLHNFNHGLLRWVNFVYVPTAIFAILLTASRGSLISAAPVALIMVVTLGKTSLLQRILLIIAILGGIGTAATLIPEENLERLSTTNEELAASDLNGRVTVWRDGYEIFENNVVLGVGTGSFRTAIETGKAPHNVFVALAVDIGLIGLTLFLLILLIIVAALWYQLGVEAVVWTAFLLTWLFGSMVGNWEYENVTWLFFCFIIRCAALNAASRRNVELHPISSLGAPKRALTPSAG